MKKIFYMMLLFLGIIPLSMCAADKAAFKEMRAKKFERINHKKCKSPRMHVKAPKTPLSPKQERKQTVDPSNCVANLVIVQAIYNESKK